MTIRAISVPAGQYGISTGFSKSELRSFASNPSAKQLQFSKPLSLKEIDRLEKIVFSKRPDICLRVYGHYGESCNLNFLERIPSLKKLSIDRLMEATGIEVVSQFQNLDMLGVGIFELENFNFLEMVNADLKGLAIYQTRSKKPRIDSISRFKNLEFLYLEGQQKGIEAIGDLSKLKEIVLQSISTENLEFLEGKNELWMVDIKLGGIKNFESLETLQKLKYLELWQVRGLSDLSFISRLETLQNLFIQSLKQISSLPDFKKLTKLRRIHLENLKGLKDLSTLEMAPALEEFIYVLAENQQPENLVSVLKNKTLKSAFCRFGSTKKNTEFDNMLKEYGKQIYDYSDFRYQ